MNKYLSMKFAIALLILFAFPIASGFANTFLEDDTMHLYKGETGKYCIYLQNTGEEDLVQIIKIFEGQQYIENLDEIQRELDVPVATLSDDLPVCMNMKLPNNAEKGEKYLISYGVTSPSSNEEKGMVSFAPVLIRENFYITERLDERSIPLITYIILIIVVIAASGIVLGYRLRRNTLKVLESRNENI